ncbi:MAG TPA: hypothetical protein VFO69_09260 [Allosphingosinicella sp.]|nr:hypothetical protein [Allosphingosinicella sp.]
MSRDVRRLKYGPGRIAPVHFLSLIGTLALAVAPLPAVAQNPPAATSIPAAAIPVPDDMALAKLLWSTMAAIDHANKTGNYSVLRSLGSPGFQQGNSVENLAAVFAVLRQERLDLADTLVFQPVYEFPPAIVQGLLRLRGTFRMRPRGVQFDLLYQWNGGWTLHGVAVRSIAMTQDLAPGR